MRCLAWLAVACLAGCIEERPAAPRDAGGDAAFDALLRDASPPDAEPPDATPHRDSTPPDAAPACPQARIVDVPPRVQPLDVVTLDGTLSGPNVFGWTWTVVDRPFGSTGEPVESFIDPRHPR